MVLIMSMEDLAQEIEAADWARNNRPRTPQPTFEPTDAGYGPAECADCDADMPVERRAMGKALCTGCQAASEARTRQFRRR